MEARMRISIALDREWLSRNLEALTRKDGAYVWVSLPTRDSLHSPTKVELTDASLTDRGSLRLTLAREDERGDQVLVVILELSPSDLRDAALLADVDLDGWLQR